MDNIDSETFKGIEYTKQRLPVAEYDNCEFINCDFSNSDISNCVFLECSFTDCNFSSSLSKNTALQEVEFNSCKLIGFKFENCNDFLFNVQFSNSQLNLASFYQLKLKGTVFNNCNLTEVDFTKADVSSSVFNQCDLMRATFNRTILEKADFRTASNYVIDPENNQLKKAKFSLNDVRGLLEKYNIDLY